MKSSDDSFRYWYILLSVAFAFAFVYSERGSYELFYAEGSLSSWKPFFGVSFVVYGLAYTLFLAIGGFLFRTINRPRKLSLRLFFDALWISVISTLGIWLYWHRIPHTDIHFSYNLLKDMIFYGMFSWGLLAMHHIVLYSEKVKSRHSMFRLLQVGPVALVLATIFLFVQADLTLLTTPIFTRMSDERQLATEFHFFARYICLALVGIGVATWFAVVLRSPQDKRGSRKKSRSK